MRKYLLAAAILFLAAAQARADLIVHYDFDGDALDSSGLGNHGNIFGSPAFVPGQSGQAISFDNPIGQQIATQYVALPNSSSILALQGSSFTFALLYRSNDTTINNGRLFGRRPAGPGSGIVFDVNSGLPETYAQIWDTSNRLVETTGAVSGNPLARTSDGEWHWGIVVLDRAAGELRQYVDANLVASVPFATFDSVLFSEGIWKLRRLAEPQPPHFVKLGNIGASVPDAGS